jgi:hypothetical protein
LEQVKAKHAAFFVVLACLIGMAIGSAVTSAFLSSQKSIPSTGMVLAVNVGAFSDAACSQNLTSIDWGNVYVGSSVSRIIYVKNTGTTPITLSMTTSAWNPSNANGQLTLNWDKEGISLIPGESAAATLTLSVSPTVHDVASFTVNVVVAGSG